MIKGDKERLEQIVQTHQCPEHGRKLVVAWHAAEDSYVIRCGEGHFPEEVTRDLTPTQEYKQGKREATAKGLDLMPKADLATGEALSPQMIEALYLYARQYGLDAYRGHIMLMYGKPYIGIDGYLYHAYKEKIPYKLESRPLTTAERHDYQVEEGAHAWIAYVNINDGEGLFSGLGIVTQEEMTAKSMKVPTQLRSPVVAAHPWQLAQKRAEWQALRRSFPIGESEEVSSETRG